MELWVSINEIKQLTGVKKESFDFKTDEELDNLLKDWIEEAMSLIISYCNFKGEIIDLPLAIKSVCRRLVENTVHFYISRSNTVIVQGEDEKNPINDDRIFTQALKDDLFPYIQDDGGDSSSSKKRKLISIAITGEDVKW